MRGSSNHLPKHETVACLRMKWYIPRKILAQCPALKLVLFITAIIIIMLEIFFYKTSKFKFVFFAYHPKDYK